MVLGSIMAIVKQCCFCERFGNDFVREGMAINSFFLFGFVFDLLKIFQMSLEIQLQFSYQAQP